MKHFDKIMPNFFSSASLDRLWQRRSDRGWLAAMLKAPTTAYLPVWQMKNLVTDEQSPKPAVLRWGDLHDFIPVVDAVTLLGEKGGETYFAIDLPANGSQPLEKFSMMGRFMDLRGVGPLLGREEAALLAYARAITYWHSQNRFCGACGAATRSDQAGHLRVCTNPQCAREHFPRTDPAIIVLVSRGDRCLLGRQPPWPEKMYSTIAGFVEPGESLEDAVAREVLEETGIRVNAARYHSSQPWPFPCSIMLGFRGDAAGDEISIGDNELEDVRWFSREEIVRGLGEGSLKLPAPISVAFCLIEDWFDEGQAGHLRNLLQGPKVQGRT